MSPTRSFLAASMPYLVCAPTELKYELVTAKKTEQEDEASFFVLPNQIEN